jgi:hypothetical protein
VVARAVLCGEAARMTENIVIHVPRNPAGERWRTRGHSRGHLLLSNVSGCAAFKFAGRIGMALPAQLRGRRASLITNQGCPDNFMSLTRHATF